MTTLPASEIIRLVYPLHQKKSGPAPEPVCSTLNGLEFRVGNEGWGEHWWVRRIQSGRLGNNQIKDFSYNWLRQAFRSAVHICATKLNGVPEVIR